MEGKRVGWSEGARKCADARCNHSPEHAPAKILMLIFENGRLQLGYWNSLLPRRLEVTSS